MNKKPILYSASVYDPQIITVHGQKVILDADLARIYCVPTKVLNQAVKRNRVKFPVDFMLQLTQEEVDKSCYSRSQPVTLNNAIAKSNPLSFQSTFDSRMQEIRKCPAIMI